MATNPSYAGTVRNGVGQVATANTNRDGATGVYVDIFTAGGSGSRLERIFICAAQATTAGFVRLFVYNGTNARILLEIVVPAITPVVGVTAVFQTEIELEGGYFLPPTYVLRASTQIGETFTISAIGGDF